MTDLTGQTPVLTPYCFGLKEAAAYLGVSTRHLDRQVRIRAIPSARFGSRILIRRVDLERLIDEQAEEAAGMRLPQTYREAKMASAQCLREADALRAHAKRTRDEGTVDMLLLAARAYTQLATFYRWNAGLEEFAPEEHERMSA